jgi:hypothetical protein
MCPDASPECIRFCLNKAGRGGIFKKGEKTNAVQEARKERTRQFVADPQFFYNLDNEISRHANKASRLGLKPCVRLNGTSDIDWIKATAFKGSLFDKWRNVQFYDYTKSFPRMVDFLTMLSAIRSFVTEAMLLSSLILFLILFVVVPFAMATIATCVSWILAVFGLGSRPRASSYAVRLPSKRT